MAGRQCGRWESREHVSTIYPAYAGNQSRGAGRRDKLTQSDRGRSSACRPPTSHRGSATRRRRGVHSVWSERGARNEVVWVGWRIEGGKGGRPNPRMRARAGPCRPAENSNRPHMLASGYETSRAYKCDCIGLICPWAKKRERTGAAGRLYGARLRGDRARRTIRFV